MIIIGIPCLLRGGTEMQTLNLVKALVASGHSVNTLCYFEYDENVVREYQMAGSSVDLMRLQRNISAFKLIGLLKNKFRKYNPEVLHIQYMAPGAIPILAARLAGVKRIFATVHQPWTKQYHGIKAKILLRISALLTDRFIAVSENAEKSWFGKSSLFESSTSEVSKSKHCTIYNATDLDKIDNFISKINIQDLKLKVGLNDQFVIGAVSRLSYEKGLDLLLEAFHLLRPSEKNVRLVIVGSGIEEENLKSLTTKLGILDKVIFTGNKTQEEVFEWLMVMDFVVCPSRFEGFGLTAVEAMACNKPVIANKTGGLQEVINDKINGFLINCEDAVALASCIQNLLDDKEIRESMGNAGRNEVENQFSYSLYAEKIAKLYS